MYLAWRAITWVLIAVFLAAALNPAVEFLQRRGLRRGLAAGAVFLAALAAIGVLASLLVPPLVEQVRKFVELGWANGVIAVAFFVLYQQLENHVLQPIIYGRTVELSPLVVLVSVLIGAELAGVLGALAAIPVAGSLQAIGRELLVRRSEPGAVPARASRLPPPAPP